MSLRVFTLHQGSTFTPPVDTFFVPLAENPFHLWFFLFTLHPPLTRVAAGR
jgi:hypothetical protein